MLFIREASFNYFLRAMTPLNHAVVAILLQCSVIRMNAALKTRPRAAATRSGGGNPKLQ
jgi:hypothetical protein